MNTSPNNAAGSGQADQHPAPRVGLLGLGVIEVQRSARRVPFFGASIIKLVVSHVIAVLNSHLFPLYRSVAFFINRYVLVPVGGSSNVNFHSNLPLLVCLQRVYASSNSVSQRHVVGGSRSGWKQVFLSFHSSGFLPSSPLVDSSTELGTGPGSVSFREGIALMKGHVMQIQLFGHQVSVSIVRIQRTYSVQLRNEFSLVWLTPPGLEYLTREGALRQLEVELVNRPESELAFYGRVVDNHSGKPVSHCYAEVLEHVRIVNLG